MGGDTATPQCALQTGSGAKYCALICTPSGLRGNGANGECGTGTCQSIQGTGLCTYAAAKTDTAPEAKWNEVGDVAVAARQLALTWKDCGGSTSKAKIIDFTPASITLGQTTTLTGTGDLSEGVTDATFDVT